MNLYIGGSVDCKVGKTKVTLKVTTDYPWDGAVNIKPVVGSPAKFGIRLRVPRWCQGRDGQGQWKERVSDAEDRVRVYRSRP